MKGYIGFVAYVVLFGKIFYAETFARDRIRISGSSTCFLYSKIIAESFAEYFPKFKTPLVESGGSGIGLKDFCRGVGEDTVDIVNSSRKITKNELAECNKNGVSDIQEVTLGYDGIALVSDKDMKSFSVTIEDLYMALAANLFIKGNLILNPFQKWSDIRPDLPSINISIYIPSDKHGTREVIEQKVLKEGCIKSGNFAKMQNYLKYDDLQLNIACKSIRKDGLAIEVDGDYAETLARIKVNKNVFGFLGLSFYKNNADVLKIIPINGVMLSVSTVTSGLYPIIRPLFFYVKKKHFNNIVGLREYVAFSVSDEMMESNSQLVKYGLIPISERERKIFRDSVVIRKKLLRRFG